MSRSFNGSSDLAFTSALPVTARPFSLTCWAKPAAVNGTEQVCVALGVDTGAGGSNGVGIELFTDNTWSVLFAGLARYSTSVTAVQGTWAHLALTYDGAANFVPFVNGTAQAGAVPAMFTPTVGLTVGAQAHAATPTFWRFFSGSLAQVGLWNIALSQANITALVNGAVDETTVAAASLKGFWRLCGTASPEPDASSGGNSLTLTGTAGSANPPNIVTGCVAATLFRRTLYRKAGSRGAPR